MKTTLEQTFKDTKNAILIGIGGGGDIVGTIPTARLLAAFGAEYTLGGLAWERSVIDPVPGPRSWDEVNNAEKLTERVWLAGPDTVTSTGVHFAESRVAGIYGERTLLVDILGGPAEVARGLAKAASKLGADLIVGIDVGGDAVSRGREPGLASPLADSIMIAALSMMAGSMPVLLGVFGFGSDGELTFEELERSFSEVARAGGLLGSWGMTAQTVREMERVIETVPTEASRVPVECARGVEGSYNIRSGSRPVRLSPVMTCTFYLSPRVVHETVSMTSRAVAGCASFAEANEALHALGIKTEMDLELEKLEQKAGG